MTYEELATVVLDLELPLNNRPLSYKDDEELPALTPNTLFNINPVEVLKLKRHDLENQDLL